MSNLIETDKITPLHGYNYKSWKKEIMKKLQENNLLELIYLESFDKSIYTTEDNARALLMIFQHLNPDLQKKFQYETNAAEMWKKIVDQFEMIKSSFIKLLRLKCKIGNCRNYLSEFESSILSLNEYLHFDDDIILELLLSGLPSEFEQFIFNIRINKSTWTIPKVKFAIIFHEQLILNRQISDNRFPQMHANNIRQFYNNGMIWPNQFPPFCQFPFTLFRP